MKKTLIALTAGILIGGGGVFVWSQMRAQSADADQLEALNKRDAELAKLKTELAGERSAASTLRQRIEVAGLDDGPVKENELDITRLLNDARPLMKSLTLMFGEQRKLMTSRFIKGMADKLADEMGLTDEQKQEMIDHFMKVDEENFAKIKAMLDRKLTVLDVFTVMKDMNPQKSMDDYMIAKLTPEQKEKWESQKLESKAQQIERTATRQLDRMTATLKLDEEQQDKVFNILVKKNPQYDPALSVQGVTTDGQTFDLAKSQDEAIAEVLHPEQMDGWNKMQESKTRETKRWSDALGGLDPTQFFQGMGGGGLGGRGAGGGFGGWGRGTRRR
ncbi:MAG TPA: hypothetical protein VHM91_21825 [Verrucomicrobiales bacterium]|jgi:hypothetical protein|nr:hypothetical protein [Verrucomicrobiales bacterium]